jgi:probable HAF family extracellular repeat protein
LWNRVGQITDLGVIGSDTCSFASSINAQGQVVGDSKPGCGPDSDRSFLWEDGSIIDLNTLIPSGSPLYLQFTDSINDRGEITGNGSDASGNSHAFLLIPCDESHPNVEGCDYSLVDASAASSQPIDSAPSTRGTRTSPPRTNHQFRFPRRMTRTEGGTQ